MPNQIEEITKSITRKILNRIKDNERAVSLRLTDGFKEVIKREFINTKEYLSIINGVLRTDFGLGKIVDGAQAVSDIIDSIDNAIQINFESTNNSATFTIECFRSNFEDALGSKGAHYTSDGKNGGEVEWLSWLLFKGNEVVNPDFGVLNKKRNGEYYAVPTSRTGNTIMRRMTTNFKIPFSVNPEFQGTEKDNWITRVSEAAFPQLVNIINKEADRIIKDAMGTI